MATPVSAAESLWLALPDLDVGLLETDLVRPSRLAERIREEAIMAAWAGDPELAHAVGRAGLISHPRFLPAFKLALAASVACTLGEHDAQVRAVYAYDSADALLHLLVIVGRPSAALTMFVASLDRALAASLDELSLAVGHRRVSVLDVNLITPKEVRLGIGPAALLSAVYHPPLAVWSRDG
jgi:hypothetical protein